MYKRQPQQTVTGGSNHCIPIQATDIDNNNITLTAASGLLPQAATFTVNNSTPGAASGTFCFTPTAAHLGQTYTVTTVSYTHLDVYKRQIYFIVYLTSASVFHSC